MSQTQGERLGAHRTRAGVATLNLKTIFSPLLTPGWARAQLSLFGFKHSVCAGPQMFYHNRVSKLQMPTAGALCLSTHWVHP